MTKISVKDFEKLKGEVDKLKNELLTNINNAIQSINNDIKTMKTEIVRNQEQTQTQIKTQEEIIMDMIQKFDDQFTKDRLNINREIEEMRAAQDILKISFTVNEKQLLEKIQTMIFSEVRNACGDKEREILMKLWIDELKKIIADFEKLKKMHPKEFTLRIDEIANTIDLFKQKFTN